MSIEEIKSEIEQLTSKSLSEVIAFALHVREQREISTATSLKHHQDEDGQDAIKAQEID